MQVLDIMHQGVLSVDINDSIKKVANLMKEEDIGAVPVLENGTPVGFVTDRDIVLTCVANGKNVTDPISLAMTEEIFSIEKDQNIEKASELMQKYKISRLLVTDNEKPVGIISLQNLCNFLGEDDTGKTLYSIKN